MRARTRFALAVTATAAMTSLMTTAANASTTDEPARERCGVTSEDGHSIIYRHCADTWVWIQIDKVIGANDFTCVGPRSTTHLGTVNTIRNAWYDGRLCAPGS